jgi:hypothetical protein
VSNGLQTSGHQSRTTLVIFLWIFEMANKTSRSILVSLPFIFIIFLMMIAADGKERKVSASSGKNSIAAEDERPKSFNEEEIKIIRKWADYRDPDALFLLAREYSESHTGKSNIKKNHSLAVELYKDAADLGHPDAQAELYSLYATGYGVPQNDKLAFGYLEKATTFGNPAYQARLATEYYEGTITTKDEKLAHKLFLKSAEQGFGIAQAFLATNYRIGKGVEANLVQAYKWHHLAKMTGHPGGGVTGFRELSFDELLAEDMPQEDVKKAQRLVDEWLAEHPGFPADQSYGPDIRAIYEERIKVRDRNDDIIRNHPEKISNKVIEICILSSAKEFEIPSEVLLNIHIYEGGKNGQMYGKSPNRLLGLFKIHEDYAIASADRWKISTDEAIRRIKDDPCINARMAGWQINVFNKQALGFDGALRLYAQSKEYDDNLFIKQVAPQLEIKKSNNKPKERYIPSDQNPDVINGKAPWALSIIADGQTYNGRVYPGYFQCANAGLNALWGQGSFLTNQPEKAKVYCQPANMRGTDKSVRVFSPGQRE